MSPEDLEFLYEHARNYGGTAYAEWLIEQHKNDEQPEDFSHTDEYRRFETEQQ